MPARLSSGTSGSRRCKSKWLKITTRYALIATVTDYDSWREEENVVTAAEVFKTLHANAKLSRHVAAAVLEDLNAEAAQGDLLTEELGSMKFSIMPRSGEQKEEDREKLRFILPAYF